MLPLIFLAFTPIHPKFTPFHPSLIKIRELFFPDKLRTPWRVRREASSRSLPSSCFSPRTPCGVRQAHACCYVFDREFQSTHSLRSATKLGAGERPGKGVSIHALLAECDPPPAPPYAEYKAFQSTHSLRSATRVSIYVYNHDWFQSTHSLRSATIDKLKAAVKYLVSIHALLAECDSPAPCLNLLPFVSIHALLAECDYY